MSASVLLVTASARYAGSNSRALGTKLASGLAAKLALPLVTRDVAALAPVSEGFVNATFVPAEKRSVDEIKALSFSDEIVAEAQAASTIILATPMYNFGPAPGLKSWADNLARIGVTFEYGADGKPIGKLTGKKVITVVASGGVPEGAPFDALSPWLKAYMPFVGLGEDHTVVWQRAGDEAALAAVEAIINAPK
jgi:FMN-dependent NADH-azoreductase